MPSSRHGIVTILRLLLFTLILWHPLQKCLVHGAILPPLTLFRNKTSPALPVGAPSMTDFHCSHGKPWSNVPLFDYRDCFSATRDMEFTEMSDAPHGTTPREFLFPGVRPSGQLGEPVIVTKKYVTHSCTLAILMRSAMHPGDLPGEDYRSSVVSDVSSFEAIMEAADFVYALCGKALRSPGWAEVDFAPKRPAEGSGCGALGYGLSDGSKIPSGSGGVSLGSL